MDSAFAGMRFWTDELSVLSKFFLSFPQAVSAAAVKMATIRKLRLDLSDAMGRNPEKRDFSAYWDIRKHLLCSSTAREARGPPTPRQTRQSGTNFKATPLLQ
jgi:hypothetical protein